MRAPLLLPLALMLLAGCTSLGSDDPAQDNETSSATPEATPTAEGSATAPASPAPTPAATPPPSATPSPSAPSSPSFEPRPFYGSWTHEHEGAAEARTFDVPPGHAPSSLVITLFPTAATMGCDARAATVVVQAPTGMVLRAQGTDEIYCGATESARNVTMTPGRWTIWFNGTAPIRSTVFFGEGNGTEGEREPFSFEATHDYVDGEGSIDFEVPAGVQSLVVSIEWSPGTAPVGCTSGMRVTLTDADGATVADEESVLVVGSCGSPGDRTITSVPAGTWTVAFTGQGLGAATLQLTE